MKIPSPTYKVPFDAYGTLFENESDSLLRSRPCTGSGSVKISNIEKGLQVLMYDCTFREALELQGNRRPVSKGPYFTLAFFMDVQHLQFGCDELLFEKNAVWDVVFISSVSGFRMYVPPLTRVQCLSINFSQRWLQHNIPDNEGYTDLMDKMKDSETFLLLGYMSASEKERVPELIRSSSKPYGSFYIKSCVLELVSDFLINIRERENVKHHFNNLDALLAETEKSLCDHVTGSMPGLQNLAHRYCLSLSTLKRQFKKRYGVNLSDYFIGKKMEYAQQLLCRKGITAIDAARMVGYKNVNHFITMFKRYNESFTPMLS
jgi:AraC-like DNA-binding protein